MQTANRVQDICDGLVDELSCCYLLCPQAFSGGAAVFALLALAIERCYATVSYKTYEQYGSKSASMLSVVLALQVIVSVASSSECRSNIIFVVNSATISVVAFVRS